MKLGPDITVVAALIGDPARANMLLGLMDGGSLTAGELAEEAGITPSTASWHLSKLRNCGLVVERKEGRNRYFALSDASVAGLIENLMTVSEKLGHFRHRRSGKTPALRHSRVCYDHLAGERGVWMFERLRELRLIIGKSERLRLTKRGDVFVREFGIDVDELALQDRALCRPCPDWSEQSYHLGGSLGSAFLARFYELNWASRQADSRIVRFTSAGNTGLQSLLGAHFTR